MCEEFGLTKLMTYNKSFDPELIKQFYSTIHFQEDEACTFSWLTNGEHLVSNMTLFGQALGYPHTALPATSEDGCHCRDSTNPQDKKVLKRLYIKGFANPGKKNDLLPVWDIMLWVFCETVNPKGGNFDEIHHFEVDLLYNARKRCQNGCHRQHLQ